MATSLSDMYQVNEDGSYKPFDTVAAAPTNTTNVIPDWTAWLLSQRQDTNTTTPQTNDVVPKISDPDPQPTASTNNYVKNADGSYQPFGTAPVEGRTADGGFTNNVIPEAWTYPGSLIQTAQQMGVNPATYDALNLQASYAPEYQSVGNVGTLETPTPINLQSGQVDNQTSLQQANTAYLSRLANEATDPVRQLQNTQNNQAWNTMFMNSEVYNPNGANSYAIQHNQGANIPLFTENAPAPYNPGGGIENPVTPLPKLNEVASINNTGNNTGGSFGGYYDEYGFGKGPKYNQWDNANSNQNQGKRNINFGRALWRL